MDSVKKLYQVIEQIYGKNLQRRQASVAAFQVSEVAEELGLRGLRGLKGVKGRQGLGQDVVHGGVNLQNNSFLI